MFQIGDIVVCGSNGVCQVEKIGPLSNMGKSAASRGDFYTLRPFFDNGGRIYMPTDNDKTIRYILTKEEVNSLIGEIDSLDQITINDEKQREAEYKNAVNSSDPRRLISVLKTMYFRKVARIANGKKSTAIDDKYFKIAETRLYDELSLSLGCSWDEARECVKRCIVKD